jgi:prepilin-type N-terminal cleavage/methylation domain-containing protein
MMKRQAAFTLVELLVALFITAIMFTIGYRALDQAFRSRLELNEQSARLLAVQQALRTIEQDVELLQPRPVRNLIGDGYLPALISAPNVGGLAATPATSSSASGSTTTFMSSNSTLGSSSSSLGSPSSLGGQSSTFGGQSNTLGGSSSGSSSSTPASSTVTLGSTATLGGSTLNSTTLPLVTFTRGGWTNPAGLPRSELQRVSYSIENGALMRSYSMELDATGANVPIKRKLVDHVRSFTMRFMDAGHQWQTQWPPITAGAQQSMTLRMRPVAIEITIELDDWGILMRHIEVPG